MAARTPPRSNALQFSGTAITTSSIPSPLTSAAIIGGTAFKLEVGRPGKSSNTIGIEREGKCPQVFQQRYSLTGIQDQVGQSARIRRCIAELAGDYRVAERGR